MDEKPTILLAEDHPVNAEVAEHIIRRLGYQVDLVGDGYAVLEAVHRKHYPVVLMDLRMPRMDGLEAARRIRAEIPRDRRPVIAAMTADVTRVNEQKCRELGMVAFIPKPISQQQLAKILATYAAPSESTTGDDSVEGAGSVPLTPSNLL